MGFNKRFLNEKSIRDFAKNNSFLDFQKYMVNADSYIIEGIQTDWARLIHDEFCKTENDSAERKELHRKIVNNSI